MKRVHQIILGMTTLLSSVAAWALNVPGPVVDVAWLAQHQSQVQIVEIRSDFSSFKREPEIAVDKKTGKKNIIEVGGHIADARLVDMKSIRVTRKIGELSVQSMLPEKTEFEKIMQNAGIDADKPIVVVPMGQSTEDINDAARLFWQLKVYGETNMALLDGGVAAWLLSGKEVTVAPVAAKKGTWRAGTEQPQWLAESAEVAAVSHRKGQLVDGRPAPMFYGLTKRSTVQNYGHIENAKLVTPDVLTNTVQGAAYFFSPKTYVSLFAATGVDASKPTITYCNTGHLASGSWFILSEIVGNSQTKLYDGSMHQWSLEKRPSVSVTLN